MLEDERASTELVEGIRGRPAVEAAMSPAMTGAAEYSSDPRVLRATRETIGDAIEASQMANSAGCPSGRLMYNSICLPEQFPPRRKLSRVPVTPPYIQSPPRHSFKRSDSTDLVSAIAKQIRHKRSPV